MNIKLLGLALVGALAIAAPSFGGGQPIVAKPLAVGMMKATTIHATTGAMVLESIRIAPGGSFGWHTHGSPVAVVVTSGTLTVFDPSVGEVRAVQGLEGAVLRRAREPRSSRAERHQEARHALRALSGPGEHGESERRRGAPAGCNA